MSFKYEIGDEFRDDRAYFRKIAERKTSAYGTIHYWVEDESGTPSTYLEYLVDGWTKIEPFFEVGDTFTSPYDGRSCLVTHIDDELKSAWVVVTPEDGSPFRESMGLATWRFVKEGILRNREG